LVCKLEGKRPFGRPRHVNNYNIKMELRRIGCKGIGQIELAQDRVQL
jgi:hypothetical protein